jgi:hypothetical protein
MLSQALGRNIEIRVRATRHIGEFVQSETVGLAQEGRHLAGDWRPRKISA